MLKYIGLREEISEEYFYCDEILIVNANLPKQRVLEIIREYLELE
jgi:hypothetical protein